MTDVPYATSVTWRMVSVRPKKKSRMLKTKVFVHISWELQFPASSPNLKRQEMFLKLSKGVSSGSSHT